MCRGVLETSGTSWPVAVQLERCWSAEVLLEYCWPVTVQLEHRWSAEELLEYCWPVTVLLNVAGQEQCC